MREHLWMRALLNKMLRCVAICSLEELSRLVFVRSGEFLLFLDLFFSR